MADQMMQGGGQMDDDADTAQDAARSVTITDNGDGTYSVSLSAGDDDGDDDGGGDSGDGGAGSDGGSDADGDAPQQVDNLDDALQLAGALLSEGGDDSDADDSGGDGSGGDGDDDGADDDGDGDSDSAPMSAAAAKSYWRQMASKKKRAGPM